MRAMFRKPPAKPRAIAVSAPRPTRAAAFLLATALSIPVFVVLSLVEWILL